MEIERRFSTLPVESRSDGKRMVIGGYAAKFNRLSQNLGGFVERLAVGTFDKSKAEGWPGVLAAYNHNDNIVLGTIGGRTLRLNVDSVGLGYEADLPQSRADVFELIERGDVRRSSFAFSVRGDGDDWTMSPNGLPMRTLLDLRLHDVAPVNTPAYEDTSVGARSIDGALESLSRHFDADLSEVRTMAQNGNLTKFFARTDHRDPRIALSKALSKTH